MHFPCANETHGHTATDETYTRVAGCGTGVKEWGSANGCSEETELPLGGGEGTMPDHVGAFCNYRMDAVSFVGVARPGAPAGADPR